MAVDSAEQAYRNLFDRFMTIPDGELAHCNGPLDIETDNAKALSIVAVADRGALIGAGIDPLDVDTLTGRVGAFAFAAAAHEAVMTADPAAVRRWKERSRAGYELRQYLLRFFAFAYRNLSPLLERVTDIREGRANSELALDLLSLSTLGTEHPEPLFAIPMFDKRVIVEAKKLHGELTAIRAEAAVEPAKLSQTKLILDHAYTYYREAADEVRAHGRFLFEGTERCSVYVSDDRLGRRTGGGSAAGGQGCARIEPKLIRMIN